MLVVLFYGRYLPRRLVHIGAPYELRAARSSCTLPRVAFCMYTFLSPTRTGSALHNAAVREIREPWPLLLVTPPFICDSLLPCRRRLRVMRVLCRACLGVSCAACSVRVMLRVCSRILISLWAVRFIERILKLRSSTHDLMVDFDFVINILFEPFSQQSAIGVCYYYYIILYIKKYYLCNII